MARVKKVFITLFSWLRSRRTEVYVTDIHRSWHFNPDWLLWHIVSPHSFITSKLV